MGFQSHKIFENMVAYVQQEKNANLFIRKLDHKCEEMKATVQVAVQDAFDGTNESTVTAKLKVSIYTNLQSFILIFWFICSG